MGSKMFKNAEVLKSAVKPPEPVGVLPVNSV